jgi:hypothetical protein
MARCASTSVSFPQIYVWAGRGITGRTAENYWSHPISCSRTRHCFTRDSRSDPDYPRDGSLFDLRVGFSGEAAGGELNYETYDVHYSKYLSVGPGQVLAVRGAGCFASGKCSVL